MMICILCGGSSQHHPLHPTDTLKELVRTRACNGPIVYPAIMAWDQPTICACRLCFHQLRRVKPRTQDRQPLPLDAAVLQTVVPGTMRQQDSRTRERICTVLKTPGNAYSKTFEALMSLLTDGMEESDAETLAVRPSATRNRMETWWKYNLQTECFSHKAIARHVRRCGL
jgi:hypothetical protein